MRSVCIGLLLLGVTADALAQPDAKSQHESTTSQELTVEDLQGVTLNLAWTFTSRFRNRFGEFTGGRNTVLEIKLGPDGALSGVSRETGWADTPNGRKSNTMSREFNGKIGTPNKNKDGSAEVLWLFEGNKLTRLSVVRVGGNKLEINLSKTATGLTCTASNTVADEVGAGNRVDRSPAGGSVEVLSTPRLTSISCRATKPR
jgi:hypothetical protein